MLFYRLEVTAAKIQQSLPEAKRNGDTMVNCLSGELVFEPLSTIRATSVLNQVKYIPHLLEKLKTTPDEVVADMLSLRQHREQFHLCPTASIFEHFN